MRDPETRPALIQPEAKLPVIQTLVAGLQHVVAMFGATVLAPLLMGFDPNLAVLFSGVGTLLFLLIVRGKLPSYLGSSFAFITPVMAATGYAGAGPNANIGLALGGIMGAGILYTMIGLIVWKTHTRWIERLLPPLVTGAIVMAIGLNLSSVAVHEIDKSGFDTALGLLTIVLVTGCAAYLRGFASRLPILIGGLIAYLAYALCANGLGYAAPIDFASLASAGWLAIPHFSLPILDTHALFLIAPVAIVLVAENLGHVQAVSALTERDLTPLLGRAFLGDGLATILSGSLGGTGVTTYAENIGVMAITRNFSVRAFVAAACFAILFGFSPKFGALVHTIPLPVLGGLSFVVFGLIAVTGARIWIQNGVDLAEPRNLSTAGIAAVIGAGNLSVTIGTFTLGAIGVVTVAAILLYHLLGLRAAAPRS